MPFTALLLPLFTQQSLKSSQVDLPTPCPINTRTSTSRPINLVTVTPADGFLCSDTQIEDCAYDPESTLGAEISGVSDFTTLTDGEVGQIRNALNKHKIVYFKGAAPLLTPRTQLAFADRLGDVLPTVSNVPKYVEKGVHQSSHSAKWGTGTTTPVPNRTSPATTAIPGHANADANATNTMVQANRAHTKRWRGERMPEAVTRVVREPGDPFAFGEGLHADVTFLASPPAFTFLAARELPGGKDDTHFVDAGRAWRALPSAVAHRLAGASVVHSDSAGLRTAHPAVRTHPETGEQAIYANSHFSQSVRGYHAAEGQGLLAEVFEHLAAQPVFRFKWQCADADADADAGVDAQEQATQVAQTQSCDPRHVLLWDNRALQHTATTGWSQDPALKKRRREIHRVMISDTSEQGLPFYRPHPAADQQ